MQRQRSMTIKNVTEGKKKFKSLIGFLSANKIDNYNREGGKRKKKKNRKEKISRRIYRTTQKIRIVNVFLESLLSESLPSLGVTVHLTFLGCLPTLCYLWICCGDSSDSNPVLFLSVLPSMSTAIRAIAFSFVGALNGLLYIPQTQSLPS